MRSVSLTRWLACEPPALTRRCAIVPRPHAGGAEPRRSPGRAGATLTEVLMAILIMAVGVVSVFTLFPISVIRTIQATNQTNAKILKENVEEQASQSPRLLFQFSASTLNPAPVSPLNGFTMQGEWQPQFGFVVGDVVVPTIKAGSPLPRPLEFFQATVAGNSGRVEPVWNPQAATITDGAVTWAPLNLNRFVVDPLGLNTARSDGQSNAVVDTFGNTTDRTTGVATANGLPRLHGGLTHPTDVVRALRAAADVCVHPDSWQQLFEATPLSVTPTSVSFPGSIDLTGFFPTNPAVVNPRVVLTSLDGQQTVVRELITPPAGQTVSWSAAEPLPARFPVANVGLARIEVFNRRYSWFVTVRNVGPRPEIKCVVTFNRAFTTAEEHVYAANFGNPNIDMDGDSFADGDINEDGTVDAADGDWSRSGQIVLSIAGTDPEPLLKAGNWLFDARDASWYRIQSIDESSTTSARITLDRTVRATTPDDGAGPPAAANPPGRAMLLPGIVEVFDL